ncbi:MAG: hypothetical protein AMXMBFR12_09640 [Candidatus Babeliales bacterium]
MKKILLILATISLNTIAMNVTEDSPIPQKIEPWGTFYISNSSTCEYINRKLPMRCDDLIQTVGGPIVSHICYNLYDVFGVQSGSFLITNVECLPESGEINFKFEFDTDQVR